MDRGNYDNWLASGGKTLRQKTKETIDEVLQEHQVPQLDADIKGRVRDILERAAKEAGVALPV